nr:MAG TPA: hypothetical protein [Bacteriophage sp.]
MLYFRKAIKNCRKFWMLLAFFIKNKFHFHATVK